MTARRQFGRIRKLPSGRWQVRYPDGSGSLIAAPPTFAAKADASRFLAQIQADRERGQWVDPRSGHIGFSEWVAAWLRSNPSKRATTLARDRVVLETHFDPSLGERKLGSIMPADIKATVGPDGHEVGPYDGAHEPRGPASGVQRSGRGRRHRPLSRPRDQASGRDSS